MPDGMAMLWPKTCHPKRHTHWRRHWKPRSDGMGRIEHGILTPPKRCGFPGCEICNPRPKAKTPDKPTPVKLDRMCEICGHFGSDVELVSDGTDSGESDWLCAKCRGVTP